MVFLLSSLLLPRMLGSWYRGVVKRETGDNASTKRPRLRRVLIYVLFLLLLLEVGSRTYLAITMHASWFAPGDSILNYYPEVKEALHTPPMAGRPTRILLLGGSVVARGEQDIQSVLLERLRQKSGRPVQVVNVASPAHTTLDSLRKYRLLADERFDLVIFYHGINDVRANLCPDDVFQPDYTHMLWHRLIHRIEVHPELSFLAHPYVAHLLWVTVKEQLWPPRLVPMRTPDGVIAPGGENVSSWRGYGATIKTRASFQRNVEAVIRLARQKGEPLLLMTFATYPAPHYSFARFKAKNLDYAKHWVPTEVWGAPAHVPPAVAAHNEVICGLAREQKDVHFLDMAGSIPHDGVHFDDICHLSFAGKKAWVEAMLAEAMEALTPGRSNRPNPSGRQK